MKTLIIVTRSYQDRHADMTVFRGSSIVADVPLGTRHQYSRLAIALNRSGWRFEPDPINLGWLAYPPEGKEAPGAVRP